MGQISSSGLTMGQTPGEVTPGEIRQVGQTPGEVRQVGQTPGEVRQGGHTSSVAILDEVHPTDEDYDQELD